MTVETQRDRHSRREILSAPLPRSGAGDAFRQSIEVMFSLLIAGSKRAIGGIAAEI
jgi:hypothetical protein